MQSEKGLNTVRRWYEELWSGTDLEVADQIVHPDYAPEWINIEASGPEQVKHEVRYFRSVFPDLTYEIVDAAVQADKVWVRYKGVGTHLGAAWGFQPSGKRAAFEGITIFTLNAAGRITDRWSAHCFYDLFADLGVVPPFTELSEALGGSRDWDKEAGTNGP